ncbi:MAG: cation:proton antiporter [Actinobacteria bacterium]|nr:cation:proton antiporter [Actinomycetota bacterium]
MEVVLLELGAIILALALLARLASRTGFSPIPLYLLAGLAVSALGGVDLSREAIQLEADIAVALLLFMLGLEYTGVELSASLRTSRLGSAVDFLLNFTPGFAAGFILGWSVLEAVVLGGITYISSSGIIAKVLDDLNRLGNRETPAVLSLLVTEDLAMAIYLPLVTVALAGGGFLSGFLSVVVAVSTVLLALYMALRHGRHVTRILTHASDEVVLLSVLALLLLVAALGELLQFSAAVGAFLLGIALSGSLVERARLVLGPLRDLLAAVFFLLFAAGVEVGSIPGVFVPALVLAVVTMLTKLATGWVAARSCALPGRVRAGAALMSRGEFSVVIADLAVVAGSQARLGPLAVTYVLITAVVGPLATRYAGLVKLTPPTVPQQRSV